MEKIPVLTIVGPTACGKTGTAIALAKAVNGEVVSADSMQIYEKMDIATAKPTVEEMQGIKHHMIGVVGIDKRYSVADFVNDAKACINDVYSRKKVPILVGGTGLYIDTLIDNIQLVENKNDLEIRKKLKDKAEKEGAQKLLDELEKIDPKTAEALHPNNIGRIIRALEVYYLTGTTMSQQVENSRLNPSPYDALMIGLNFEDREKLYERINKRVDDMLERGLLEEAKDFIETNPSYTSSQAIGYKELRPYFEGKTELPAAVENLKRETRRYAKRQLTWFRKNERIKWFYVDRYETAEKMEAEINKLAKEFLKGKESAL